MKLIIFSFLALFLAVICIISCNQNGNNDYLNFPKQLSASSPYDVDTVLERKLLSEKKLPEAQRIFDILSWQLFISLNWPVDDKGHAMPDISDKGDRAWESWKESFEIFKDDGSAPLPWGSKTQVPDEFRGKIKERGHEDILFRTSKFSIFKNARWKRNGKGRIPRDQADEINQAFTAPIWDQNGNMVRYEIRMNKIDVTYIEKNELYNLDGQIAFSDPKKHNKVFFPVGDRERAGTIELKFAWKVIVPGKDFPERYFTKTAYVYEKNGTFKKETVGLVGMHIGIKTKSSPQWIWATFEQVDNLETNELDFIHGRRLTPSFYNPDCSTCPVNLLPDTTKPFKRNQIQRVLPIPVAVQELNRSVQGLLKEKKSFWQYYELIGTQWPTDPSSPPYPYNNVKYVLPDAVTNKSGGKPVPTYLTNMVMETYFQGATVVGDDTTRPDYNKLIANEQAYYQIEGGPKKTDTPDTHRLIFGTEGCMGCHHSGSIALRDTFEKGKRKPVFGPPGAADFEWLLQQKAQYKKQTIIAKNNKPLSSK